MPLSILYYHLLHLLKFSGVILFGGGVVASFVAKSKGERQRAVHGFASAGLAMTWLAGYLLTVQLGIPLSEPWILGGLGFSFLSQIALVRSVGHEPVSAGDRAAALLPLFLVLVLMVFRPTWSSFK